jgi:pimeloyl-ACP methyl ester carboxylesterase
VSYEERKVRVPDGLDIFLRDYAGERGERGLPVICLHGLTRNSADFEVVAPRIAETGRRVLVLDVRGRGRSERDPKPERYAAPVYAMDVVHIMGALEVERAVFVGTSMGGLMTMIVAATAPGKVAAAVLNDIGPVVNTAGAERIAQYVGKTPPQESWAALTALVKAAQGAAFPNADDVFWERVTRRVGRVLDDGRVAFDYDPAIAKPFEQPVAVAVPDLTPLFLALKETPVLVVHGMLSDILLPEGVAAMRAVKPDIDIVDIPGIGHAPTLEESAAWSAIERFLRRVP